MKKPIKMLVFSDVHLGHRKTPTSLILKNLVDCIKTSIHKYELDIIFISGDLFDRLLNMSLEDAYDIHSWMAWLLRLCKKHDIILRVLEGTPSHDWKQSRFFDGINDETGIQADAKFIPTLSIEYNERLDVHILYIPDEWNADNDDTWLEVQTLMAERGLDHVDFTIMHGQFAYQLPPHVQVNVHEADRYADITKHYVFCGHVHNPSQYRNIIVPGSFDRISHGEEEKKGYWVVSVDPDGDDHIVFHENVNSMKYVTLNVCGMELEDIFSKLETSLQDLPDASHVRLSANKSDAVSGNIDVIRKMYPQYQWSTKINIDKMAVQNHVDVRAKYTVEEITPKNILDVMAKHLKQKDIPLSDIECSIQTLGRIIDHEL